MVFADIQKKAISDWQALESSENPTVFYSDTCRGRGAGSLAVLAAMKSKLGELQIKTSLVQIGCIGLCYVEPLIMIARNGGPRICYCNLSPEEVGVLLEDYLVRGNPRPDRAMGTIGEGSVENIPRLSELPVFKSQMRRIMRRCGLIDPENIDHYIANGGYSGLLKALDMSPHEVLEEVKLSGLRGRGGAGFPTGLKWQFCHNSTGAPKYLICNADEGDPGTFVDRTIMESDPHAVIDGMLIGAYAIGATEGYIYVRAEYPLAAQRLKIALNQATEYGLLGQDILNSSFTFSISLRCGAGAYVCGEETALINSIEGKVGWPRVRPPYPAQFGLFGRPTVVNNVETLANIPLIFEKGGDWFASIGTGKSRGTKLFSISGNVTRTVVAEVPFGTKLRTLIEEIGGGVPGNRQLKALQPGGAMLGLIPAGMIDEPIDFERLTELGSGVGSGGIVVMDDSSCVVDTCASLMAFASREACGKCMMGQKGTKHMLDILQAITHGDGKQDDMDLLQELGETMAVGTLCPLCAGATSPFLSTRRHFPQEWAEHIEEHRCTTGRCPMKVDRRLEAREPGGAKAWEHWS